MRKIFSILLILFVPYIIYGQTKIDATSQILKNIIPPSPQAAAYARYGEYPVDHSTGVPKIEIPIYTIKIGHFELPLSISYHASGNKVNDVSTPLGLGWVLNAGGVISRTTCGAPDDFAQVALTSSADANAKMNTMGFHWWKSAVDGGTDSQSDRYSYNFNGKSGIFRVDLANRAIKPIPFSPVKFEYIAGGGYKATDTDGTIYYFQTDEFSSGFPTSWYVTKIVTGDMKEEVLFNYSYGIGFAQMSVYESADKGDEFYTRDVNGIHNVEKRLSNGGDFRYILNGNTPRLLSSISWRNNSIALTYSQDRTDLQKERLNRISVKSGSEEVLVAELSNRSYHGGNRMRLDALSIKGNSASAVVETYNFTYNSTSLPAYITSGVRSFSEDYWGYYNGRTSTTTLPVEFMTYPFNNGGTDRSASEIHMKAAVLEKITFPTGGSTHFDFEANKTSQRVYGGLRVKSIINKDADGKVLSEKHFSYVGTPTIDISSDLYRYVQAYRYVYYTGAGQWYHPYVGLADHDVCVAAPLLPLTGLSGNIFFNNQITEYDGNPTAPNGKIVYEYIQDKDDLDPCSIDYPYNDYRFYSALYNCDEGAIPALLRYKTIYGYSNSNYQMKRKETNNYILMDKGYFCSGVNLKRTEVSLPMEHSTDFPYDGYLSESEYKRHLIYHDVYSFQSLRLLSESVTDDYETGMTIRTTYGYDSSLRNMKPVSVTVQTSTGENKVTEYKYPFHLSGSVYSQMQTANMVDPVIETREYHNNELLQTSITSYKSTGSLFVPDVFSIGKGSSVEERIKFGTYDSKGNLCSYIKDKVENVVYLWSYGGQYPVAEIRNVIYQDVQTAATSIGLNLATLASATVPDMSLVNQLRSKLPLSQVTTWTYKPLIGMVSQTTPDNNTTLYEYDSFGKLKEVSFQQGSTKEVLEYYEYKYRNQ